MRFTTNNFILLIVLCYLLMVSNLGFAQGNSTIELLCENEDVLILKEKVSYTFVGVKALFLNLIVDKEIEYKILNSNGIEKIKTIILPEPIDKTYFVHAPDIRNITSMPDNISVLSFSGKVIKSDRSIIEINANPKLSLVKTLGFKGFFGQLSTYRYDIPDLKVGDVVKIGYKISIPFRNNIYSLMVSRFFFHREYPVQSLDFSFSYNRALQADTTFYNNCRTDPTICENNYCYQWHFDNLPGCLDEEGSRPFIDLPWFSFHPKMNESLEFDFDSFREDFIKPWYLMTGDKEGKFDFYLKEAEQGINNQDNSGFNKNALKFNIPENDSLHNLRLWRFQKWMADSTTYHPDTSYYQKEEMQLVSKPGKDLSLGFIRDHSKDEIYAAMLPRLGYGFVNAYLIDKRIGEVSSRYFASLHDNDVLFAVPLYENSISYIIPSSDRNHYYFEELPFYYENTPAIIMHPSDFKGYKRNFYDSLRIVNTPGSAYSENIRNTSCLVDVHTSESDISFSAKMNISGQYSTLTRSIYLGLQPDNTINPLYLYKFWEIGGLIKQPAYEILNNDYVFPYKTTITAVYHSNSLHKTAENNYEIDMKNWCRHIVYPGFLSINRITDFYPDFQGSDKYFYLLNFDKNIELIDFPTKINIENKLGTFIFNLQQTDKNKLLITSFFVTKGKVIPAANISDVEEIFGAINSVGAYKIKFKEID